MNVSHLSSHWRIAVACAVIGTLTAATTHLHAQAAKRASARTTASAAARTPASAVVRSVTRTPLPKGERIIIELSSEVRYASDRVTNPDRVYFDFQPSTVSASVVGTTRSLSGGSLVSGIRLGQFSPNATRLVLDLAGNPRYSAFPMYSPFRLVIDVEADPAGTTTESPVPSRPAAPPAEQTPVKTPPPALALNTSTDNVPAVLTPRAGATQKLPPAPAPAPPVQAPAAHVAPAAVPPTAGASAPTATTASVSATELASAKTTPAATPASTATTRPAIATSASPLPPAVLSRSRDYSLARQLGLGVARVVIDPGHGGHDPGARGVGVTESELVLDIALRLEKLLKEQQGVEVVLTRRTDEFIPLEERTAIANREDADLFLSIHANASTRPAARGIETYFLNFATDPDAEAVAARENASSSRNMGKLPDLVKTIALNNKVVESRELASLVQSAMVRRLKTQNKTLRDLGVKQAPFVVLIGAEMPSVLAEISFVTNKTEATLLKQQSYRDRIAQSLADGVLRYQSSLKKMPTIAVKRADGEDGRRRIANCELWIAH